MIQHNQVTSLSFECERRKTLMNVISTFRLIIKIVSLFQNNIDIYFTNYYHTKHLNYLERFHQWLQLDIAIIF